MVRFLAPLLFAAVLAEGQEASGGSIRGVVLNSVTGEPVAKASILVQKPGGTEEAVGATTDATGSFHVTALLPGRYVVSATRNGFLSKSGDRMLVTPRGGFQTDPSGKVVNLGKDESVTGLKITLAPQSVISGRILDAEGDAMQGIQVRILRPSWVTGSLAMVPVETAQSNDLGAFRVAGLGAGRYYVMAVNTAPRFGPALRREKIEQTYPNTYYPGVTELAAAQVVELTAGAIREGIEIRMHKMHSFRVSGELVAKAAGRTQLQLVPEEFDVFSMNLNSAPTDSEGKFEFRNVMPGRYVVIADMREERARAPIVVDSEDVRGVKLHLEPGFSITAKIKWDGVKPEGIEPPDLVLMNFTPSVNGGQGRVNAETGEILFQSLQPGRARLAVNKLSDQDYVKSVRYENVYVEDGTIDMRPGATLEIELKRGAGSVEGTASGPDGVWAGATVLLLPTSAKRNAPWLTKRTTSDQNGHYSFKGVAPGDYELYAFDVIEQGAWFDPEFSNRLGRQAEKVQVSENATVTSALKVIIQ